MGVEAATTVGGTAAVPEVERPLLLELGNALLLGLWRSILLGMGRLLSLKMGRPLIGGMERLLPLAKKINQYLGVQCTQLHHGLPTHSTPTKGGHSFPINALTLTVDTMPS